MMHRNATGAARRAAVALAAAAALGLSLGAAAPAAAQDAATRRAPSPAAPAPLAPAAPGGEAAPDATRAAGTAAAPPAEAAPDQAAPDQASAAAYAKASGQGARAVSPGTAAGAGAAAEQDPAQAGGAPADVLAPAEAPAAGLSGALDRIAAFLDQGGPAIQVIAALSVATAALILWKIWRLVLSGAWSRRRAAHAVAAWEAGSPDDALCAATRRGGMRNRFARAAMQARMALPEPAAREETARCARRLLRESESGLRALELIAAIAPLLGLLGTVLGMIAAFQALQEAGARADPGQLAGGIREALLTTAAGMAVAIPASAALTWFEAAAASLRSDLEDIAARIFVAAPAVPGLAEAAPNAAAPRLHADAAE